MQQRRPEYRLWERAREGHKTTQVLGRRLVSPSSEGCAHSAVRDLDPVVKPGHRAPPLTVADQCYGTAGVGLLQDGDGSGYAVGRASGVGSAPVTAPKAEGERVVLGRRN
jgi:hypothetical protein